MHIPWIFFIVSLTILFFLPDRHSLVPYLPSVPPCGESEFQLIEIPMGSLINTSIFSSQTQITLYQENSPFKRRFSLKLFDRIAFLLQKFYDSLIGDEVTCSYHYKICPLLTRQIFFNLFHHFDISIKQQCLQNR